MDALRLSPFGEHDPPLILTESRSLEAEGKTPVPKIDKRFKPPRHYTGWEAEALGQGELVRLLTEALENRVETHPDDLEDAEQAARDHWQAIVADEPYAYETDWTDPRRLTDPEFDAVERLRQTAMAPNTVAADG